MTTVQDVMTRNPVCLDHDTNVIEAAHHMERKNIGDILVMRGGQVAGIVTDRDIVVRCLARDLDPKECTVGQVMTDKLVSLSGDKDVDEAIQLMRERKIRRVPVMDNGRAIGIVSLGDLAQTRDPRSVLGEISHAPPNN